MAKIILKVTTVYICYEVKIKKAVNFRQPFQAFDQCKQGLFDFKHSF